MKRKIILCLSAFCIIFLFSSCENKTNESEPTDIQASDNENFIYGEDINDGTYEIEVDSSSSMFNIEKCSLIAEDGNMTAVMTMHGKGYLYVFMGKGEAAKNENDFIPFAEDDKGMHTFTIPVEALDKEIYCSAFSKNKEKWYDRTLVFRSDSLPKNAFKNSSTVTAETLGLKDGEYLIDVSLEGGSGRASIRTPAGLKIENGKSYAEIIWNSPNYDYVILNGIKYDAENTEDSSIFNIPVEEFDYKMPISADTTAMSVPHEIEYTLYFDSSTIR